MPFLPDLAINLLSGFIGVSIGTLWAMSRRRFRYRKSKLFWKPFVEAPPKFVAGALDSSELVRTLVAVVHAEVPQSPDLESIRLSVMNHISEQEVSGLIGRGDLDAIVQVSIELSKAGLRPSSQLVTPSDVGERTAGNFILVGGPDVNPVTERFAKDMHCKLSVAQTPAGRNAIYDADLDTFYEAENFPREGGLEILDYGLLARAPNPYDPSSVILILAGAHGLGTLAAAQISFLKSEEMLNFLKMYNGAFECLVSYQVVRHSEGWTYPPKIRLRWGRPLDR